MISLAARAQRNNIPHVLKASLRFQRHQNYTMPPKHFKATLDGGVLYVDQDVAEALGWTQETSAEGVSLRLSGWGPHYFAITQKGTDADMLAQSTVESSQNPRVQATLEHLKKTDSE